MSLDRKQLGQWGEHIAEQYLIGKGYRITERNYRKKWGEIDIIAEKKDVIIFVEVKTREYTHGNDFLPEYNVNSIKRRKLRRLGEFYINEHKYRPDQHWQIDVISIILDISSKKAKIKHIENAVWGEEY